MPASIILSNLSLSTPDGRSLFSNIDLTFAAERTGLVGRNGVGKTMLLASISGEHVPQSGRVLVNGTIGLLRQDVQPLADATVADLFGARLALELLRRAELCLLILDEPTNHLDIESIEAVEAGLRAYDGALLVVSHDEAFLQAIGITRRVELVANSAP